MLRAKKEAIDAEMPASPEEIEEAIQEGIKMEYLAAPVKVIGKNGKVTGIECIRMELGEPDDSGRRRPVPVKGSEFTLDVDAIIPAIGQKADLTFVPDSSEISVNRWNTFDVDEVTFATNVEGVFAGGDGVALFSTSHPLVSGGVNSNTQATPTDLNETALENAVIQIAAWTDERGLLIASKPSKLIVPPALQFTATRLLETELRVSTADNDINALKNNGSISEGYCVNHYLTDTNAWFLTTDVPNGLKHFVRTPLQNSMDGDFDTGNVRYKARERYSFGWSDPLGMFGSSGST